MYKFTIPITVITLEINNNKLPTTKISINIPAKMKTIPTSRNFPFNFISGSSDLNVSRENRIPVRAKVNIRGNIQRYKEIS